MKTAGSKKPVRTCVVCGKSDTKDGFVRFVRGKDGLVTGDASRRAAGRGAYICAEETCFAKAVKQGRLGRALRCSLNAEDHQRLGEAFNELCLSLRQTP